MDKEWLFGKTLSELTEIVTALGMPRYTATQIAAWLYKKGVTEIDQMTNLSLKNRERLAETFCVGVIPVAGCQKSVDGTKKYLFPTLKGHYIESAYIPDKDRATLCVSIGMSNGVSFLYDGTTRIFTQSDSRRNSEPDSYDSRE